MPEADGPRECYPFFNIPPVCVVGGGCALPTNDMAAGWPSWGFAGAFVGPGFVWAVRPICALSSTMDVLIESEGPCTWKWNRFVVERVMNGRRLSARPGQGHLNIAQVQAIGRFPWCAFVWERVVLDIPPQIRNRQLGPSIIWQSRKFPASSMHRESNRSWVTHQQGAEGLRLSFSVSPPDTGRQPHHPNCRRAPNEADGTAFGGLDSKPHKRPLG